MDQQTLAVAVAAALGFAAGIVVAWLILRARYQAQQDAAVAISQAGFQATLAAAQAQAGQLDTLLRATQNELGAVRAQAAGWRDDLDTARDNSAKFEERAKQIPGLEERVRQLEASAAQQETEVRRLTGSESDKASELRALVPQVSGLEAKVAQLSRDLEAANTALQAAGEAKAGFESTAARVPGLEAQVKLLEGKLETANQELANARETAGEPHRVSRRPVGLSQTGLV